MEASQELNQHATLDGDKGEGTDIVATGRSQEPLVRTLWNVDHLREAKGVVVAGNVS